MPTTNASSLIAPTREELDNTSKTLREIASSYLHAYAILVHLANRYFGQTGSTKTVDYNLLRFCVGNCVKILQQFEDMKDDLVLHGNKDFYSKCEDKLRNFSGFNISLVIHMISSYTGNHNSGSITHNTIFFVLGFCWKQFFEDCYHNNSGNACFLFL